MKNKDLKKGRESIIGKIIYGFLLFMPLIAIFSTILINTFNMASKQETKINYKYETNEVNSNDDLVLGNIYRFYTDDYEHFSAYNEDYYLQFTCILDTNFEYQHNSIDEDFYVDIKHDFNSIIGGFTSGQISFYEGNDAYTTYTIQQQGLEIEAIVILTGNSIIASDFYSSFSKVDSAYIPIDRVETNNLNTQEVFYNAVNKVEESDLFNWAENTLIYTGLNNTCNQLGITTTFVPLLLAYWLIISVIYILYDIILMILIILHNRVHKLQDSMN